MVKVSGTITKGKRHYFSIIAEILAYAIDGALKTQLMYNANLSYAQLKNFISMLSKLRLLETTTDGKKIIYKTTEKGKRFLSRY